MKKSTILSIFIGLLFAFIVYKILYPTKVVSSGSSSANTGETPTIVTPPTIMSNPSTVIAGTSVTFSASNITGVCHWFKNGSFVAEGQFLTIANPTATDIYTAKNFFNNIYSEASAGVTVGTVTVTVSPPTIVSNPVNVIAGTPVTFTATIAAGINQWLKNGVYLQDGLTLTVANPTATDVYTSKCYSQNTYSVASNAITVQAIALTGVMPFMFAGITNETATDTFSPDKFAAQTFAPALRVRSAAMPKTMNADLGVEIPNFLMVLHTTLSQVYKAKSIDVYDSGFLGSVDNVTMLTQNTEWHYYPFGSFVTSLPFVKRVKTYLAPFGAEFLTKTDAEVIQIGNDIAANTYFGNINVNGKSQEVFTSIDCEGGGEDGVDTHRTLLLLKTIKANFAGIFGFMYMEVTTTTGGYATKNGYPDANGNLNMSFINPILKDTLNDGSNFKALDYTLLAPMPELSHYGETRYGTYHDGVRQLTPYGAGANNEHYLQRAVSMAEKNYYAYKKLGGSDLCFIQSKTICDRGTSWKYSDGSRKTGGSKTPFTEYLSRDQSFKELVGIFMSGCHHNEWNRPVTGLNADSMNGYEGGKEIVKREFEVATGEWVSLAGLRSGAFEFSLWNAQYKLTGETNWRTEDGYDLAGTQDNLLVRFLKKGNVLAVFVADPYNEATKKDNLQVKYGTFEHTFTLSDWKSCYSDESTKDYILAFFKI